MQVEEPLLPGSEYKNLEMDVWVNNRQCKLRIDEQSIKIGNQYKVKINDAIGLIRYQKKPNGSQIYRLYTYERVNKFMRPEQRYLNYQSFEVTKIESQNELEGQLIPLINCRKPDESTKMLICFNPNAGSNSRNHLNSIIRFLEFTNLTYEIFQTQYRNHCLEKLIQLKKNNEESQYTAVAIVSGDGLMHQYVNSFSNIPVTHVPAGSGNAFAKTQMTSANQLCKDEESIYLVIKNRKKKFNIVKYQLEKIERPIYSFLSLSWGIMSDLDINSEFLRCLGGLRFEVYAVWRLIKMRRYRAKLTFSSIVPEMPDFSQNLQTDPNYQVMDTTFLHTIFCMIPYISDKYKIAPLAKPQQRFIDMQVVTQETGRIQLTKYLLNSDSGSHFDIQNNGPAAGYRFNFNKLKSFRLEPLNPNQMGIFSIDGEAYESQKIQGSFCESNFEAFA